MGCSTGESGKLSQLAGDDVNKMATKAANEGLLRDLEGGLAEVASDLFWMRSIEAEQRRRSREEKVAEAARAIQRRWQEKKEMERAWGRAELCHIPQAQRQGGAAGTEAEHIENTLAGRRCARYRSGRDKAILQSRSLTVKASGLGGDGMGLIVR